MPNAYEVGTRVECHMLFYTDPDDPTTLADPTTITFRSKDPNGVITEYVYPTDAELVKVGTGEYYVFVTPDSQNDWFYAFEGTGTVEVTKQGKFTATRTIFQD